jgi:hypothetical protein
MWSQLGLPIAIHSPFGAAQAVLHFQAGRPEGIVDWVDIVHFVLDPLQLLLTGTVTATFL